MKLRALEGPYFVRDDLPFLWQIESQTVPSSEWEMARYLTVLADFEHGHAISDAATSLQNAKLDLALLWFARSFQIDALPPCEVAMGLTSVSWFSAQALPVGQSGQIHFCLSQQFPLHLQFPAQIMACEANGAGFQISAQWLELGDVLLDQFEKTVFRYHRRQISSERERI